ncbi:ankyrin repeat-containing domain protein [Thelonectria olida]|uniref:Ankyrin repeat-containing domain protein n=1 Tax=Thelonectria olida TaxID=1576542 RepID=A0A9P8VXI3_9HYPO|nr:ankyrin repeat-containing domain protein [Thelonectria olida]
MHLTEDVILPTSALRKLHHQYTTRTTAECHRPDKRPLGGRPGKRDTLVEALPPTIETLHLHWDDEYYAHNSYKRFCDNINGAMFELLMAADGFPGLRWVSLEWYGGGRENGDNEFDKSVDGWDVEVTQEHLWERYTNTADENDFIDHKETALSPDVLAQIREWLQPTDHLAGSVATDGSVDISVLEQSLPVGLEQTYASILAKQRQEKGVSADIQVLVLEAVTHSPRPLRLNELASLVKYIRPDLNAPAGFKELIATCCGPLIEVLEDETLQVIHHSFTEFLRGDTRPVSKDNASSDFPLINSLEAHKRMALNCLRYLQSGTLLLLGESAVIPAADLSPSPYDGQMDWQALRQMQMHPGAMMMKKEDDVFNYQDARLCHPFLGYAVENWSYHTSHYDVKDDEFFNTIQDFIKPDSLAFRRWLTLQWGSSPWKKGRGGDIPTVLHVVAFAGMSELAAELMQQGVSISSVDGQGRVPIHWAAENGHAKVASLLIQHGCDPDTADKNGLKPLHLAAKKNHASVVTVLLKAGVEPRTVRKMMAPGRPNPMLSSLASIEGESAILYASEAGHTETVTAMIPFCNPETLEQLLCECCRFGQTDSVLAILDKTDVSANASYRGGSALYFACVSANAKCVSALISRGADVHKMSKWESPLKRVFRNDPPKPMTLPLHDLVRVWNKKNNAACLAILKVLIKAGADLEQPDSDGNTALIKVVQPPDSLLFGGLHVPALKALLDSGADAKATSCLGNTSLHVVAEKNQDLEAVRLLINHGVDPNQRNNQGTTPFHIFMDSTNYPGYKEIEKTKPILKFLLDNGADPECRVNQGWSPMGKSLTKFGSEVFGLLLSKCKSESTKTEYWFSLANERDNGKFAEALELMLAAGMDIDQRAKDGRTLYLHCLGEPDKRRILLRHEARTDLSDNRGNNAIHLLLPSARATRRVLESLLAEGLDPLSTNDNGDTLLHHAAFDYLMKPNHEEDIRWLVSLGIPVNAVNKQGHTALHLYMQNCWQEKPHGEQTDFIGAINDNNDVDFEIRDNDGLTVLHMAVMNSGIDVSKLMAAGANLSALTKDSQNVLHLACRARMPSVVAQILSQLEETDMNQADSFGRTPLHYACASGEAESVALLLKHGADVNAVDSDGCTLLHACAQATAEQQIWDLQDQPFEWLRGPRKDPLRPSGSIKYPRERQWTQDRYVQPRAPAPAAGTILKMLLDANLDPAATDGSSCTALDVAIQQGCTEFVEVFYQDEELFESATRPLEENNRTGRRVHLIQQEMKTQMAMMRPRSCLDTLSEDRSALNQVSKSPARYLELMTRDDAVRLINQGFEADPTSRSFCALVKELMKPGHLQLVERLPHVISQHGTHESVKDKMNREQIIERDPDDEDVEGETEEEEVASPLTPLQMVCHGLECSMLMVQHLVEKLHVDVNARVPHKVLNDDDGEDEDEEQPAPGGNVLHILASADDYWQLEALKYLIVHGADVNALDEENQSPIHIAASGKRNGYERIVGFWRLDALRILLDHGADPNVVDKQGLSPLHKASNSGDTMKELLRRGADVTVGLRSPVFTAIYHQNLETLEALLDHGLSVNTLDVNYRSSRVDHSLTEPRKVYALLCTAFTEKMRTSISRSVPLLRALVERGADLYLPLNDKETMIHFLFEVPSQYDVPDALLQEPCVSRIDFNRRDQLGRTVLMAACCWQGMAPRYSEYTKAPKARGAPLRILDRGADATLVDQDGKTALHHLLDNPGMSDDVLIEFINREEVAPSLCSKDNEGFTAFHYALRTLRPAVCSLLLSKGAQISEPDPRGLTALHHISNQCLETERFCRNVLRTTQLPKDYFDQCVSLWQKVLAEGVSINVIDNAGNTPLHTYLSSPERRRSGRQDAALCHIEHFNKLFPPDSGVDVSATNHEGETALHIITARKKSPYGRPGHDKALFEMLLARGADPLREDAKGSSALDVASACGKDDIVGILSRRS